MIGAFLNHVGNSMLNNISNGILKNERDEVRRVFYPGHAVLSVSILNDGFVVTRAYTIDYQ